MTMPQLGCSSHGFARRRPFLRSLLATLAFACAGVAHSNPAHYATIGLDNALTCAYAVKWDAPKAPLPAGEPPELLAPSAQAPIKWPRGEALFKGDRHWNGKADTYGYNPLFARTAEIGDPNNAATARVSFAFNGRPIIRDEALNLRVLLDNGQWQTFPLRQAVTDSLLRQGKPWDGRFGKGVSHDTRVVFDDHCHAYTVVNAFRSSRESFFLLHSRDGGTTWAAYPLPGWQGDGDVRIEVPTATKMTLAEPPVIVLHQLEGYPQHRAVLLFPKKNPDGTLKRSADGYLDAVSATVNNTICCARHAGHDTQVVSLGDKVHFAYPRDGTLPFPSKKGVRHGTPQFVATFSRSTGDQEDYSPQYLGTGFSGPVNAPTDICRPEPPSTHPCPQEGRPNAHNQPTLAIDKDGFLHAIVGGHSSELQYFKSTTANSSAAWSLPVSIGTQVPPSSTTTYEDSYTYASMVLDGKNRPHVFARWSGNGSYLNELVHIHRETETGRWLEQQELLIPDRVGYTNWYNKVAVDRWGRLFVSYWYYPADLFVNEAERFKSHWGFTKMCRQFEPGCGYVNEQSRCPDTNYCSYLEYNEVSPGLLISTDAGATFRLATSAELFSGPVPASPPPPTPRPALEAATRSILLNH